jgi:RHH-type transcriptional regulator, rel operon repressor / antitoxin RelB
MSTRETTITVRLAPELKAGLERLSEATDRTRSWLAQDAIRKYIELNEWQIREIEAGIAEADAGRFATAADVAGVRSKWGVDE